MEKMIVSENGKLGILVKYSKYFVSGVLMTRRDENDLWETVDKVYPSGYEGVCAATESTVGRMIEVMENVAVSEFGVKWSQF